MLKKSRLRYCYHKYRVNNLHTNSKEEYLQSLLYNINIINQSLIVKKSKNPSAHFFPTSVDCETFTENFCTA